MAGAGYGGGHSWGGLFGRTDSALAMEGYRYPVPLPVGSKDRLSGWVLLGQATGGERAYLGKLFGRAFLGQATGDVARRAGFVIEAG